jgi:hypothetical protein
MERTAGRWPEAVRFAANDNNPVPAPTYARLGPISRLALRVVLIAILIALFFTRLFSL